MPEAHRTSQGLTPPFGERAVVAGPAGSVSALHRRLDLTSPPVILIHGLNGGAEQWSAVIEHLDDWPVIAVDLRGHGRSGHAASYTPKNYVADVLAVLEHFAVSAAHVVGASLGGAVATTLAAGSSVLVRSMTIVGGAPSIATETDVESGISALRGMGAEAFFTQLANASFAPDTDDTVREAAVRLAADKDVATIERIMRDAAEVDVSEAAATVDVPCLVLTGEHDQTCPPDLGAALAAALRGRHQVLPGQGHMVHLEDPALTAGIIADHAWCTERSAATECGG